MKVQCCYRDLSQLFSYPEALPDKELMFRAGVLEANLPDIRELQSQYVRLFINALPQVPCPPYGSIYLEGSCMGETTVTVRSIYRKYGFETDEMPDHIAVELEFLDYLKQAGQSEEIADSDFVFLLTHLKSWAPAFFERVEKNDKNGFYRAVAQGAKNILLKGG
ncbi:MAG: molecular chaperone TorD family protein [Candidatus Methanoperedens sp.]|nr:molecular chaperone TorD family protein [Candidatus Methanoperedens sp.]